MVFTTRIRAGTFLVTATLLSACQGGFDMDMRRFGDGLSTSDAAVAARAEARPAPDSRGVISYPSYQVAVAQPGDTVASLAARVGLPAAELASHNGLPADATFRGGEVVALPRRVAEPWRPAPRHRPGPPVERHQRRHHRRPRHRPGRGRPRRYRRARREPSRSGTASPRARPRSRLPATTASRSTRSPSGTGWTRSARSASASTS